VVAAGEEKTLASGSVNRQEWILAWACARHGCMCCTHLSGFRGHPVVAPGAARGTGARRQCSSPQAGQACGHIAHCGTISVLGLTRTDRQDTMVARRQLVARHSRDVCALLVHADQRSPARRQSCKQRRTWEGLCSSSDPRPACDALCMSPDSAHTLHDDVPHSAHQAPTHIQHSACGEANI